MFIISLLISCSSAKKLTEQEEIEKRWFVLEHAVSENWTQEKILQELGQPQEKSLHEGEEFWSYDAEGGEAQQWSVRFNPKNREIKHLAFSPYKLTRKGFTLDEVLERWKKFDCKPKEERFVSGHTVHDIQYYVCDGGKRVDYNRYKDVSWIRVKK